MAWVEGHVGCHEHRQNSHLVTIQRLQSSPLKLYLTDDKVIDDAFALVIPHIPQLKSLTIILDDPCFLADFRCHTPLLETLDINVSAVNEAILDGALLTSLRYLTHA